MTSRSVFVMHIVMWVAATALWTAGAGAAGRYDTATPHTPPYAKHKYIPLHSSFGHGDPYDMDADDDEPTTEPSEPRMPPSEFLLTALRTALDVVRNINKNRAGKSSPATNTTDITPKETNETALESGRGFEDYYDDHHYHDTTTTTAKPMKQGRYTDPWAGYYDWIINEGSFKFWSVFQLFTAALLLYACFSAIYYAKFNPIIPDYDREYDDYFLERSVGRQARSLDQWDPSELASGLSWINPRTFQFILDAISKHYEEQ